MYIELHVPVQRGYYFYNSQPQGHGPLQQVVAVYAFSSGVPDSALSESAKMSVIAMGQINVLLLFSVKYTVYIHSK